MRGYIFALFLLFLDIAFTFFLLFLLWELKGELNLYRKYVDWGTTMIKHILRLFAVLVVILMSNHIFNASI